MRELRLRPQNTKYTMLTSEELGTQKSTSSREDRVCKAWTHGSQVDCLNFKKKVFRSLRKRSRDRAWTHGSEVNCLNFKKEVFRSYRKRSRDRVS